MYSHFGSASAFIIFDTQTGAINTVNNQDLGHAHGMCSPLKALDGESVDAIVVGGIGVGVINKLNMMGIKVYRASLDTVQKNIELLNSGALSEISVDDACGHHGGGGCGH